MSFTGPDRPDQSQGDVRPASGLSAAGPPCGGGRGIYVFRGLSFCIIDKISKPGICLVEERAGYEGRDLGSSLIDCVFEASQWKVWIVSVGGFLDKPPSIVRHEDNHRVLVMTSLHQSLLDLNKQLR